MISNKRRDSIRNIALIIHKYNNYEFPFRIVDFIRKLDKVKLIAYSYMISCGKFKNEKDIVARCTHSDDGATYAKSILKVTGTLFFITILKFIMRQELGLL